MEDFEPSSFGFRSIRPRTREERRSLNDKVALEKNRINQRVGFEAKIQRANAPATSADLTSCGEHGAGYLSNADRFHSDTAGEEFQHRQEINRKKDRAIDFRRNQSSNREEDRWKKIEQKRAEEEEHWTRLRSDGKHGIKNQSAVDYDITTLQYDSSAGGDKTKYDDDMVKYRARLRTVALVEKGDSKVNYNIVSGDPRSIPSSLPRPTAPYAQQVTTKVSVQSVPTKRQSLRAVKRHKENNSAVEFKIVDVNEEYSP